MSLPVFLSLRMHMHTRKRVVGRSGGSLIARGGATRGSPADGGGRPPLVLKITGDAVYNPVWWA